MKKIILVSVILLAVVLSGTIAFLCLRSCSHENLSQATCTTPSTCLDCGETITAALGHTDGEWITDKEANCTEDGSKHQVCSVCDATIKTETLTKLGHTDGQWITDKEANCTEDGSKHQVCSVCDATIKTETLTKLGHTDGQWVTDKEANCTEDGSKHQVCSVCDATIKTETLTKLGHTDGKWITDKNVNCTEDGSRHQICSICEETIRTETLEKFGHNYKVNLPNKACINVGIPYQCQNCDDVYTTQLQPISADIEYCYWGYINSENSYVQDVIIFNGIQGGYGKYTITITYTDPRYETHVYTHTNVADLHTTEYLGTSSWAVYYRQLHNPFVVIEISDELGFKTTYTAYFPTLDIDDYFPDENSYSQNVTINVSTDTSVHAFGEWHIDEEATCTETGTKHHVCLLCAKTETGVIPALGHEKGTFKSAWQDGDSCYGTWECKSCGTHFTQEYEPLSATFSNKKLSMEYGIPYYRWNVTPSGGIGEYTMSYFVYEYWTGKVVLASGNLLSPNDTCIYLDTHDYSVSSKTLVVRVFIYDSVGTVTYDFILNDGHFGDDFSEWISTPYVVGFFIENDANYA